MQQENGSTSSRRGQKTQTEISVQTTTKSRYSRSPKILLRCCIAMLHPEPPVPITHHFPAAANQLPL